MILYVRERGEDGFARLDVVDDFQAIVWTDRYWKAGDFELRIPASQSNVALYTPDRWLELDGSDQPMIIERSEVRTDAILGTNLVVTGRSAFSLMDRRIFWGYQEVNGVSLQTFVKNVFNDNFIASSTPGRTIPYVKFRENSDGALYSPQVVAEYLGDNIYEKLVELFSRHAIGVKGSLENDSIVFEMYKGLNRSYSQDSNPYVVFSPDFENLRNSEFIVSYEEWKNLGLIGGHGEKGNRHYLIAEKGGSYSGADRRELYIDASSVSDQDKTPEQVDAEMYEKGYDELYKAPVHMTFDGETVQHAMFEYGKDYFLGDVVQIRNEYGMEMATRVVEFIQAEDSEGESAYPTFRAI